MTETNLNTENDLDTAVVDPIETDLNVAGLDEPGLDELGPDEADEDEADQDEVGQVAALPPRALFDELGLSEPILRAVHEMGYLHPTPIQEQAIPFVLMGRDVLGCAQTGTGKTASFTLPMLDILSGSRARARMPRSLILEPTRELALQVAENFVLYGKYLKLNHVLIIGGESMNDQKDALMRGVDVLIATPGRLIDLIERGGILLSDTKLLVIDEADRMLDMGFIPDVERIVGLLPKGRQTLFFSATMATPIRRLADAFLDNPKEITVSRPASVAATITTGLVVVEEEAKNRALRALIEREDVQNALIFCNRKRDVDVLYKSLAKHGFSAGALHGDMTQPMRFATLEKFKAGTIRLLVCSDVAARGLDIGGLSHVFNFDVPIHAEDYVHRIGRTGRAERKGHAYTIASPDDRLNVDAIETLTGLPIPRMEIAGIDHAAWSESDRSGGRGRGRGGRAAARPVVREEAPRSSRGGQARPRRQAPPATALDDTTAPPAAAAPDDVFPPGLPTQHVPAEAAPAEPARRSPPRRERDQSRRDQQIRDQPPREGNREANREASRDQQGRDQPRRDQRRQDTDPSPRVIGFGEDAPAFMSIRRRAVHEEHADH